MLNILYFSLSKKSWLNNIYYIKKAQLTLFLYFRIEKFQFFIMSYINIS